MDEAQQAIFQNITKSSGGGIFGLSAWGLLAGIIFSLAGLFYFKIGKRDGDFSTLITGIALMAFPYFVTNALYIVLAGSAIMLGHYLHRKYF